MKIGVISDTHNHLDPKVAELFAGVDRIFHAGDIGLPWIIMELEEIAPVTAVIGNIDSGLPFRETEVVHAGNRKFLLHHIVNVEQPEEVIQRRIKKERPDVVVFGHTHKPMTWYYDGTLYFNPGYAGKQRFNEPRSVAILHCDEKEIRPELHTL